MSNEVREMRVAPLRVTCALCGSPTLGVETSEVVAVELTWQHIQSEHHRFTDRGSAAISLTALPADGGNRVAYADAESRETAIFVQRAVAVATSASSH